MAAHRLSSADKQKMIDLREEGLSYRAIARRLDISPQAISRHCLALAVDGPAPGKSWDKIQGPAVMRRGNHLIRRFTPDEDARLLEMEARGERVAQIARALGRGRNSVQGRLMTLARRDARREAKGFAL